MPGGGWKRLVFFPDSIRPRGPLFIYLLLWAGPSGEPFFSGVCLFGTSKVFLSIALGNERFWIRHEDECSARFCAKMQDDARDALAAQGVGLSSISIVYFI